MDRDLPRLGRTEAARRVPRGHRPPARRAARDDDGRVGRGGLHARRVPARTGSSWRSGCSTAGTTTRTSARRSTGPGSSRVRSPTSRSAASRRRRSATSSGRRPARRPAARSCSWSRARRRSSPRSRFRRKAGRCCSTPRPPTPTDAHHAPTAARSPASRAGAGRGDRARADGVVRVEGDVDARRPRRRQHGVHDLDGARGRTEVAAPAIAPRSDSAGVLAIRGGCALRRARRLRCHRAACAPGSRRFWTWLSGAAEIGVAVGVARPATRRVSALGAALLFVLVFPANVQMAIDWRSRPRPEFAASLARLPLQIPLVWWAWRRSRKCPAAAIQPRS